MTYPSGSTNSGFPYPPPGHPLPPTPDTSGQFRRVEAAPRRRWAWPWIVAAVVVLVVVGGGIWLAILGSNR